MDRPSRISAVAALGKVGLPMPAAELGRRTWDVIIVGAGHNGLSCAAYLARAGLDVLVLEANVQVGGACTLEETWPGYRISPCAYLVGLLHPLVIEELGLCELGLSWKIARSGMFVPSRMGLRSSSGTTTNSVLRKSKTSLQETSRDGGR